MTASALTTLTDLAAERATGALLADSGVVYLVDGEVVHAESPAAPGIDVLLTHGGRLPAESWQEAVDRAGPQRRVGSFLVSSGQVAGGELEICHLSALFDAAYFALSPDGGPVRFRSGAVHWLGPVRPVRVAAVEREIRRRRALLDRLWPRPEADTAPVVPCDTDVRAAAVTCRQRAVLSLADGVRTATAIAWLLGRPAFHTLVDVRRLAAAGLVRTPPVAPARAAPPVPPWVASPSADPDIALLRRLRDALEAQL
ncbi:transcriptional regulator [Streptomyces sp. LX-29]|uniref:transcriptional regulator n=1 Tax=Streptomyces sp. LX-29 TaxID=2900152 RepID=UPI00240D4BE3|nr:transcriptional regulator [Streptomyces sp. LX-29]WFB10716.1 transcriptional regulator [Streptomyces sp. LX-29]